MVRVQQAVSAAAVGMIAWAVLPTPTAVAAEEQPFDVALQAKSVRVSTPGCRRLEVVVTHTGVADRFNGRVDLYKGKGRVGTLQVSTTMGATNFLDYYYWCPTYEGFGTFRWGPTHVAWSRAAAGEGAPAAEGTFTDASTLTFSVKQDQRATVLKATKKQGRLTLSARFRHFDVAKRKWQRTSRGAKVVLQRQSATGWKTLRTGKVGKGGVATLSAKAASGKATYRLFQPGSTKTWSVGAQARR